MRLPTNTLVIGLDGGVVQGVSIVNSDALNSFNVIVIDWEDVRNREADAPADIQKALDGKTKDIVNHIY